jgi:hypothetical protein
MNVAQQSMYQIKSDAVGLTFMQVVASLRHDVGRGKGLILNEIDTLSILFYVHFGLGLPQTYHHVQQFLGYESIGINGLEPRDFLHLFQVARHHATTWRPLERVILQEVTQLDEFSRYFVRMGNFILNDINQMPVIDRINQSVGETEFPFDDEDHRRTRFLITWLDGIEREIDIQKTNIAFLLMRINVFRDTILHRLQPYTTNKQTLIRNNNLDREVRDISAQIQSLKREIQFLEAEYRRLRTLMFTGAPGGLIGIAITSTIFGRRAADIRRDINQKLIEKYKLNRLLADRLKAKEVVESMDDFLCEMTIRLQDVEQSTRNLEFVWEDIGAYIKDSSNRLGRINEGTVLLTFANEFSSVVYSWTQVSNISKELQTIIDDANRLFQLLILQGIDRVPPELLLRNSSNINQVNLIKSLKQKPE